jgi:putative transposase
MSRPPRLAGFDYQGKYDYLLTFCTFERRAFLRDAHIAQMVLSQFRRTAARFGFALSAYCVMPDHVHLLVKGLSDNSHLRQFVQSAKRSTGQSFARRAGHGLWQEGYYDRVVRPEESLLHMARYILENPVRAGLVETPRDYPYAGSDVWTIEEILQGW